MADLFGGGRDRVFRIGDPADATALIGRNTQRDFTLQFVDEERALLIHRYLHEMKEPYKEVFNLRVFGELSFEKIGSIFGKSAGWARVTYYRAKQQIALYMEVMDDEK